MTNDLIAITEQNINGETVQAVSARELYLGLGLDKSHWARWADENIEKNEFFSQGIDFIQLAIMASHSTPNPPKDFAITLRFAQHIAMMARTEKSHEYRDYLLACEKKLKQPKTQAEMLVVYAQQLVEHERRLAEMEEYKDRVHRIEAKQQAFEEGHSFFTVLGYGAYKGITIDLSTAQKLGKQASALSRDKGIPIDRVKDQRFGAVNAYHETVLNECVSGLL